MAEVKPPWFEKWYLRQDPWGLSWHSMVADTTPSHQLAGFDDSRLLQRWHRECASAVRRSVNETSMPEQSPQNFLRKVAKAFGARRPRRARQRRATAWRAPNRLEATVFPDDDMMIATTVCWDGKDKQLRFAGAGKHVIGTDLCHGKEVIVNKDKGILPRHGLVRHRRIRGAPVQVRAGSESMLMLPCSQDRFTIPIELSAFCNMPGRMDEMLDRQTLYERNATWLPGVWAVLTEHRGGNVGHFGRDINFLAHWIHAAQTNPERMPPPAGVFIVDAHGVGREVEWSWHVINHIVNGTWGLPVLTDPRQTVCFDAVASKYSAAAGSAGGATLLRQAGQRHCGVLEPELPTSLVVIRRAENRQIDNSKSVNQALKNLAAKRGWSFELLEADELSFCTQVAALARAAMVVAVHGAFWGNVAMIHPRALLVEVTLALAYYSGVSPLVGTRDFYLDRCDHQHAFCRRFVAQGRPYMLADVAVMGQRDGCKVREWLENPACMPVLRVRSFMADLNLALRYLDVARWFEASVPTK
eukprot:TRINITY_DN47748_c0_g1_i1.p1 TRINITY_DN47748_c0_g1~~TRINITY_DN47748_c0_g1_i1.p1  ORF type:complete len:528 (+),score=71.25 TRINITY_DN47748_c0_g1_i1:53-1636(+)